MVESYTLAQIKNILPSHTALLELLADSFVSLSAGKIKLANPSHLQFPERDAECCIKSAYCVGGSTWVVKVAAGWYDNPKARNLPCSVGLMLVFCQETGVPRALLQDGGYLTDLRTALAACVTARCLAPVRPRAIGFVGAGTIPRLLLETLPSALPDCRELRIWARRPEAAASLVDAARGAPDFGGGWWHASAVDSLSALALECDVIFTCTPSRQPLLTRAHVDARPASLPGLHICALGADQKGKQELEVALVAMADLLVVDSPEQCYGFGELSHAHEAKALTTDHRIVELGTLLTPSHAHLQRAPTHDDRRLTIADSTGVGASDLCIAEAAYNALRTARASAAAGGGGGGGGGAPADGKLGHTWRTANRAASRL